MASAPALELSKKVAINNSKHHHHLLGTWNSRISAAISLANLSEMELEMSS
jgi:hypothetical protein